VRAYLNQSDELAAEWLDTRPNRRDAGAVHGDPGRDQAGNGDAALWTAGPFGIEIEYAVSEPATLPDAFRSTAKTG